MKYVYFCLFLIMSFSVQASEIKNVRIQQIAMNHDQGDFVFIKLETAPSRASCSTNGAWDYTLSLKDETYNSMYAMLLAAFMAGKQVNIGGTGTCNEFSQIESISSFFVN
ncbi:hypothetical protein [Gynuella sp.]|uniref:hypothetical protein n=1 Tax=Gynuella sp. TaxID=2969146 RepID=UPI003D13A321